ncbi:hypothetical protein [Bacillus thuringiensis]
MANLISSHMYHISVICSVSLNLKIPTSSHTKKNLFASSCLKDRAGTVGERSLGYPDAGAHALGVIFTEIAGSLK